MPNFSAFGIALVLAVCLMVLGLPAAARGQSEPDVAANYRMFLLTIGPGPQVYELFGHNALLIVNPDTDLEVAYNWGVFDFNQKNFIRRFMLGRMLYRLESLDARMLLAQYTREQRGVYLAELKLSPTQKRRLIRWCLDNDTDDRREYRYDYYRDNCSTRVRDAIDHATGGQIAEALKPLPADPPTTTFRWHTDRLTRPLPWLHVALHYILGSPVDQPLSRWEEAFLPRFLETHLRSLEVVWEDGSTRPLLGPTTTLVPSGSFPEPTEPPDWRWPGLAASLGMSVILLTLAYARRKVLQRVAALGVLGWAAVCTMAGGVSTFGWLFTDHVVSRYNENWLLLNPLSLPLAVAAGLMVWGRRPRWATRAALIPVGLSVVSLVLQPFLTQPNALILLFAIPLHVATWRAVAWLTRPLAPPLRK